MIEFKRVRDFGETIGAAIQFIRQERRGLARTVFLYITPALIFLFIGMDILGMYMHWASDNFILSLLLSVSGFTYGKLAVVSVLYVSIHLFTYAYVYSYVSGKGAIDRAIIKDIMKKRALSACGWLFAALIITAAGSAVLIVPGIFLGIMFSLLLPVIFFEDLRDINPIYRCNLLIKNKWWFTFGLNIVFNIILYTFYLGLLLIFGFLYAVIDRVAIETGYAGIWLFTVFSELFMIITLALQVFHALIMSFHYFSILESREMPGIMERIEKMTVVN
ncbi:MAG TPA: hypothetical protein VHP30_07080 [Ignavibacteriales bacterium]|nr:hypothetical protein [Ignavibacteriales bacterium]